MRIQILQRFLIAILVLQAVCCLGRAEDGASVAVAEKQKATSTDQLQKLIEQLGDKDYHVRRHAQDELAKLGFEAFDALNAATTHEDFEIASRAKYLLRLMRVEWTSENDTPEVKRCLRDYEFEDAKVREAKMQSLAQLPNDGGVAALCRLIRFEKSPILSKKAAITLLLARAKTPPSDAVCETVQKLLSDCKRPGALWLRTWIKMGKEPNTALHEWSNIVEAEQKLLPPAETRKNVQVQNLETTPEIAAGLLRFQIMQWKRLGKTEEAMNAISKLVQLEPGNPDTLAELLEWLTEQQAWKPIDELAERFAPQFANDPGLLYSLAKAYAEQGNQEKAEETAKRAFALNSGKEPKDLPTHFAMAHFLQMQGRIDWSKREYCYVIDQCGEDNEEIRISAQTSLSEMLHDQGEDLEAAECLGKLVEAIEAGKVTNNELGGRQSNAVIARMHFLYACHWESKKDSVKQREHLDKALEADPEDVDVLIACYRLPDQPPEWKAKIVELIGKAATATRELIAQDPENFVYYNQFAWLIGNTEGDFDEALRYSLKSIELNPELGGLYDTLARVYFAKGDLDNAVKNQTKAVELDPHSGLIRRQLETFRNQQEEKQKP